VGNIEAAGQNNDPFIAPGSQDQGNAEVLTMIADAHPPIAPDRPRPVLDKEEWLFESATAFIEALDKYYAERAPQTNRESH
jgi:hypothetical protein